MRGLRWALTVVLSAGVLALLVAGCGGAGGGGESGGGGGGSVKIVSDLPLQGANRAQTISMVNAIRLAIDQRGGKVAGLKIEYESLDDATAQSGQWDEGKCAENAQQAAQDEEIVGWIGPFNSGCAAVEIPILNEAGLVMISPANTYVGLTKEGGEPDEPDKYYPTGQRNYTRVIPADDKQGRLAAVLMREEGVRTVFILDDRETYGKGLADQVQKSAEEFGIEVVGRQGIDGSASNYRGLMNRVREANPDAIYFGGIIENNAGQLVRDKVGAGMPNDEVLFIGPDGIFVDTFIEQAGDAAEGAYVTFGGIPPERLGERGQRFIEEYNAKYPDDPIQAYTAYAYEAANVLLDAIERAQKADGEVNRENVLREVFATENYKGVLGTWSFDENGDTTLTKLSVQRVQNGEFKLDRVLDVSR
ncbi:Extracellular ligand-binding receptor [Rubrobacter xylanophilus DSM 9941]|uniref:Extracellular ligand-binding receptor n=1 Tax=Rubrobacter xylanophilus (strain DSM 9941 / JCM 11954 / NBRC 16129 / PRD-1) TaxID=266117 RepID=Q1AUE9_RUBXD|nr:branched-chain amino acid ABC transporter substrate-binding protein [Rubrobacter xylanophilus]ABG04979.1 Extracellular ligand-binding receptor [Rubrobacter xylanophilus DSM 9941]